MTTLVRRAGLGIASYALVTLGTVCVAAVTLIATPARADSMDPTPERFVTQPGGLPKGFSCQQVAANPGGALTALKAQGKSSSPSVLSSLACQPNNAAFQNMVSELGFAIAPTAFHPGRTTGFGGFQFGIESSYTKINPDAVTPGTAAQGGGVQYWHLGTQGSVDPNTGLQSTSNTAPDSVIQVYSLKARKGLPLGFEITGDVSYIANTVMWTAGADVRWALLEGFRTGWPSYLPDVSVGGGVRSLTGTSKFSLTTVGIDAQISKPITLADTSVISPYIGYQRLYIFGDSSTVDLTPNTDPQKECAPNPAVPTQQNGQPNCTKTIPGPNGGGAMNNVDFNNDATFAQVRTNRHRGIVGLNYRYEVLYLAGQFLFDLTPPNDENPGLNPTRQWTLSFEAGVYF
jgi:hypothetical protein